MQVIAFIEDSDVIKKILKHLRLWHVKRKPPPKAHGPPTEAVIIYDDSPTPGADDSPSFLFLRRDKLTFFCLNFNNL
jgi:hypothetical protein